MRSELRAQRRRPLLQERFAARVGGQERSREDAAEGRHGDDETALARDHARRDQLGDAERAEAVYHDYVRHLLVRGLDERDGDRVAQSDVVH